MALLPATPPPARHTTHVSDPHDECSHAVAPVPIDADRQVSPNAPPCTVTLKDPVDAPFVLRITLMVSNAALHAIVTLPTLSPEVSCSTWLLPDPCAA